MLVIDFPWLWEAMVKDDITGTFNHKRFNLVHYAYIIAENGTYESMRQTFSNKP